MFITDPQKGALRRDRATSDGIPALDIPAAVGGRFSVLTPVGVLAGGARSGSNTAELLAGRSDIARALRRRRRSGGKSGRRVRGASVSRRHEAGAAYPGPDAVLRRAA